MKKKGILSLAAIALAFGVVAGAVSAQPAVEAKADKDFYVQATAESETIGTNVHYYANCYKQDWSQIGGAISLDIVDATEKVLSFSMPDNTYYAIFCRSPQTTFDWGTIWNQSVNVEVGADTTKNMWSFTGWSSGKMSGSLGVYGAAVEKQSTKFSLAVTGLAEGKKVYYAGSMNGWTLTACAAEANGVWSFELEEEVGLEIDYKYVVADADGSNALWDLLNASNRKYTFVKDVATKDDGTVELADPIANGYYIVGSFTSWGADEAYLGVAGNEGDKAKWEHVEFAKGDEFKIVEVKDGGIIWTPSYGYSDVKYGNFEGFEANDSNIKVTEAVTATLYLNNSGEITFNDDNYVEPVDTDVPAEEGYYLLGDAAFTGDAETAWLFAGAVKMAAPAEGTDLGVLMNYDVEAGAKVKARSYVDGTKTWYTAGAEGYSFANVDEEGNYVFTKSGTFNFFLNAEGKLYVTAKTAPIAEDGYVYVSTGNWPAEAEVKFYCYSWTDEDLDKGIAGQENAPWPGVALDEYEGATISNGLNFNNAGGLVQVPVANLLDNMIFVVDVTEPEKEPARYQTPDFATTPNVYINTTAAEPTLDAAGALQAVVAKEIADAVKGATDASVCKVSSAAASIIVNHYDALLDSGMVDNATLWTYNGENPEENANVKLVDIVAELREIAGSVNADAFRVSATNNGNTTAIIVAISVVSVGVLAAGAMFYFNRKRRMHN